MIEFAPLMVLAAVFAAGLWLFARPWAARHWLRDAEWGHRSRASMYEAHFGEPPEWEDDFTPPPPPPVIRFAALYRIAGLAVMALAAALLYHRLSRSGVI